MTPFAPHRGMAALFPLIAFFALIALGHTSDHSVMAPAAFNHQQYVEQLQSYEIQVSELASTPQDAPALRDALPNALTVQTFRGDVTVETAFLRDALNRFLTVKPQEKPKILFDLGSRLQAMRAEADLYEQPSRADDATRKRLELVLSACEFNRVRGPSALELLKQRIQAWILKQLRKLSPKVPDIRDAGQWFVWTMIALAAAVAGVWLYRISRQNLADARREILPFMPSSRSWHEWLAQAREKAAQGQWRDAIHLGFWAAVSRLESEGVWPPDKARTPREYLSAIPGSSLSKEPFSAITRKFEASWYGDRPTTAADFAQFAANLERLGCR
jgi:Domain of unknown function (DUF4129)